MAAQNSSEKRRTIPETSVQQSVLQQAQAATAALTRQDVPLQDVDLFASRVAEDELPPPAYGDIHGEIRNEQDGLGTSATVTDDGRVNIRINQLNRRLSQIFTPALRQHVQYAKDSGPPPPSYIPPSLGGTEGEPPPPAMNVVIQVVGSRGDVQPFVALGKVLKDTYGHRVRLATHPTFEHFVRENGLEFFSIGGDPSQLMAFMVKNPALMPGFRSIVSGDVRRRRRDVAEYLQGCWRSCYQAGDGLPRDVTERDLPGSDDAKPFVADCIIANPPSFAHIHCAEKLGIPLHIMFTMPYSPTQAFPHPLADIQSSNADPQLTNYLSYTMIELLSWQGIGDIINRFRAKCLGLDPVSLIWAPGMLQRLKIPHTYCWSPALVPKPNDWGHHISISGFYFLNLASDYTPEPDLQRFLDAGPPPVYIGFGSIVLDDPDAMTKLIFEAVRMTGQRALISKGWGGMGAKELDLPESIFMLGNVPHDWLFKHVSCVVHHGGAGTTAAGISAGRPTLVVPFFGDQPFWGAMVAQAGAGPSPIPHRQLTADKLANAIKFCLRPESLERAKELAGKIAAERGCDTGAQSFHQYLDPDRLRCTLAPCRAATWRIKRTKVRLSAFAACTLANAKLLDFHDLKLFRAQEYETDEGPWDPISGGFVAACGSFNDMAMGLATVPSETVKALQLPFRSSRQQSQGSRTGKRRENSHVVESTIPVTSPGQSRTSLNVSESQSNVQDHSNPSILSSTTSNIGSSSTSNALYGESASKQDNPDMSRVRSRNDFSTGENRDMMRHTGVHMSKGIGGFTKALAKSPMDVSVSLTKGFHNIPKLWGDDTVRPQAQVSDFKSGAKAAGKEFGLGWYDGVTGLVTLPWKGAKKDGASGFFKGIGKGMGGFVTKPGAAVCGVLSYPMKGVHKEVQKLFGSNVQNYIVASRAAQGYDEWLQSSEEEKQDVIVRWELIQKHLKKRRNPEDTVRDILEAQHRTTMQDREAARQNYGHAESSTQAANAHTQSLDLENAAIAVNGTRAPEEPLEAAVINERIRLAVQETSRGNAEEDASVEQAIRDNVSELQHHRQEASDHLADLDDLHQAMAASEAEAQRHANETLEYERQLNRAMTRSLRDQQWNGSSDSELESDIGLNDEEDEEFERVRRRGEKMAEHSGAVQRG